MLLKPNHSGLITNNDIIGTNSIQLSPPIALIEDSRTSKEQILNRPQIPMIVRKEMAEEPIQRGKRMGRFNHFLIGTLWE